MLFFQLLRLIFLLYNFNEIGDNNIFEVIKAFYYALVVDNSAAGYIMMFPLIISIFKALFLRKFFFQVIRWYHYLIIFVATSISISELPVYDEWKVKLNFKAISYLANPSEIFNTASVTNIIIGFISIAIVTLFAIFIFNRYVLKPKVIDKSYIASLIHILLLPICFIWGIRGGLQPIPVHISDAYYSKSYFLNLVSVNSQWNLMSSIVKNFRYKNKNPFIFYADSEATSIVKYLHSVKKDTTIKVLSIDRPNIVIVLLESWSADVIKCLGGYDSITPQFNKLADEGILFTQVYGSGSLSDEGISAVLSGQPSLPRVIIVNQPDKYPKLPSLPNDLKKAGYYNYFLFGGQLNYGNIKSYIYTINFDEVYEEKDLPKNLPRGRLGVHDGFSLDYFANSLKSLTQPFFAMIFTLSSHSPYDEPTNTKFFWGGDAQKYINAMYYTDSCLGAFINKVKKENFYKNTLFIFVADHSHDSPKNWHPYSKEYRHIPMLWYGEPILKEYRGLKVNKFSTQVDLAATLLKQLNINSGHYLWSKDLFNPYSNTFAYYAYEDGFGWVTENNYFAYLKSENRLLFYNFSSANDSIINIKNGFSYIQKLFDYYLNL
jgi:phosphoglycerol transferase MdoB-like AlkP superfamily enzyme